MLTVNSDKETYLQLTAMVGNEQVGYIEIEMRQDIDFITPTSISLTIMQ